MAVGAFQRTIFGGKMEKTYLDGLKVARDLAKQQKMQTLDGLIEALEGEVIETASVYVETEKR